MDDNVLLSALDSMYQSYHTEHVEFMRTAHGAAEARLLESTFDLNSNVMDVHKSDRLNSCLRAHECSRQKMESLRSSLLDIHRVSGETLQKIDSLLDGSGSGSVSKKVYGHSLDSTPSGTSTCSSWRLNYKARRELHRNVCLTSSGIPIPSSLRFPFGSCSLFGWEVCALYDALVRVPELVSEAHDVDDEEEFNDYFSHIHELICPVDDDVDDEPLEASPALKRHLLPRSSRRVGGVGGVGITTPDVVALPSPCSLAEIEADLRAITPAKRKIGLGHISECVKQLSSVCIRADKGRIAEASIPLMIAKNISNRSKRLLARQQKEKCVVDPSLSFLSNPWYFDFHKAYDSHPGLCEDVDYLRLLFGYGSNCIIDSYGNRKQVYKGVLLEEWSLQARCCLQNMFSAYESEDLSYVSVPTHDRHTLLCLSTLICPGSDLALASSGPGSSSFKRDCLRILSLYFDPRVDPEKSTSLWFPDHRVWRWPRVIVCALESILRPLFDKFSRDIGLNEFKMTYLDILLYSSPFDTFGRFTDLVTSVYNLKTDSQKYIAYTRASECVNILPVLPECTIDMKRRVCESLSSVEPPSFPECSAKDIEALLKYLESDATLDEAGDLELDVEAVPDAVYVRLYDLMYVKGNVHASDVVADDSDMREYESEDDYDDDDE